MGKKTKVGKSRKDKYYQLAKETGYRARSAFKLLQLNRKYAFLQNSRVCIDLCAAPGGWLQVAAQHMPVSSHIIGIDLVGIKPIRGVITLQEDITTDKCRASLKKELQTWKADCFLNDGAPNVGQNWLYDAFQQAQLTLHALRLATEFLRKGGWFVTKVFRSKDYHALMWVFQQLFKKVYATKPASSRNESAEIFVVCQHFLAPDKLDPKFTDPKYVFRDVELEPTNKIDLFHPEKQKKRADGYSEGDYTLFHKLPASKFISADNFMEILATSNEVDLDEEWIRKHPQTKNEIKECCKDIKVLGKKEIKALIKWRKKLRQEISKNAKAEKKKLNENAEEEHEQVEAEEIDSEEEIDQKLAELKEEEDKETKRKKRKIRKQKSKLREKMDMKLIIKDDKFDQTDDMELFNLSKIKTKKGMEDINDAQLPEVEDNDDELAANFISLRKKQMMAYDRYGQRDYGIDSGGSESEDNDEMQIEEYNAPEDEERGDSDNDEETDNVNPLIIDLEEKDVVAERKTAMWFKKATFSAIDEDDDEDCEIDNMTSAYKDKGGIILEKVPDKNDNASSSEDEGMESDAVSDSDAETPSDSDSEDSNYDANEMLYKTAEKKEINDRIGFEVVPLEDPVAKIKKLDAVGLAIGAAMVQSRKRRREIIEGAYNRYTSNDDNLPDWFVKDEAKHMKPNLPVSKSEIDEYNQRMKAIDARPIKKVAEAKARKKRKGMKKLERARKKAEVISDNVDVTDREKWQQIKQVYKKAGLTGKKKKDITYVVAKKGAGKKVSRPAGVKGQFKVVDARMKKEVRANERKNARGRSKGGKGKPRGKNKR